MHIILGGTGRVGSATARALLKRGEPVTVVTRDAARGSNLKSAGAHVAVADIRDVAALRDVFRSGTRAFLLNPPAEPADDTDVEERANIAAIVEALDGSGLQHVVVASTYGARPGERCGDLTVLYEFETMLQAQPIPALVNRGAYYMSNWLGMLNVAIDRGTLTSFFSADYAFPMVAPEDLGEAAASRLVEPELETGLWHVEGPEHYTPRDVADAFADVLGITADVEKIPREAWEDTFRQIGFSTPAAQSYACMTATLEEDQAKWPHNARRGTTTLREYILQSLA